MWIWLVAGLLSQIWLIWKGGKIMASVSEVKVAVAQLSSDVDTKFAEVVQLQKSNAATPEELDGIITNVTALDDKVKNFPVIVAVPPAAS